MDIKLIKANIKDAETIWTMQKSAFNELLQKYQDYDTNPASEPLEKTIQRLNQPFTFFYFISLNREIIGAIRVIDKHNNQEKKRISPIFILPPYRHNGYAQEAIRQAELIHGSFGWELDTILQEQPLCRLYEKMGYAKTDRTKKINEKMSLVFYIK